MDFPIRSHVSWVLVIWLLQIDLCSATQIAELAAYGAEVVDETIANDLQWLRRGRIGPDSRVQGDSH